MKRDEKKAATRELISNVATALFTKRGFEAVTTQEIADAAGVSKMTVFNYFPRKEDMFLDRGGEGAQRIADAIAARRTDESMVAAVRRLIAELAEANHPFAVVNPVRAEFWEIVRSSPSLMARARELGDEEVETLAKLLAQAAKAPAHDPTARLFAATVLTIWRTAYAAALRVVTQPRCSKPKVQAAFDEVIDRGFAMLAAGMKGTPYG